LRTILTSRKLIRKPKDINYNRDIGLLMSLSQAVKEFARSKGAIAVGIATVETLKGGPPSVDLEYKLKGARSAISFALPFNQDYIRLFLSKQDRAPHEQDNLSANVRSTQLAWEMAELIKKQGFEARGISSNLKYRKEIPGWEIKLLPDLSHRYFAVASGVGSFGWSGNVGIKGFGTAIILGTCITTAELEPTGPIPEAEGFCDKCKLCVSACAVGMMEKEKEMSVIMGGKTFSHSGRKSYLLCQFCCGGFTGLHQSGKWSTWSPGRFQMPETEPELIKELLRAVSLYSKRPPMPGGYTHPALGGIRQYMTCGNCQIVCWGDKKETAKNLKLLHKSGCVLQREDGSLYALPAQEAQAEFAQMDAERKNFYF